MKNIFKRLFCKHDFVLGFRGVDYGGFLNLHFDIYDHGYCKKCGKPIKRITK